MEFTQINNDEKLFFEKNGYLIVRNLLSQNQIAKLIEAGDRIFSTHNAPKRQQKAGGLWDSYRNCLSLDDEFIPLLTHPKIISYIVQLLGPNIQLLTSHLIYRFPDPPETSGNYRPFGWHRDIALLPEDLGHAAIPKLMVKAAFYLTGLTEKNSGATLFLPESNLLKTELTIPDGYADPEGAVEPFLNAGDCLLFENRTWHAVGANLHGSTRKSVMMGYGYRWLKPVDYVSQSSELVSKLDEFGKFLVGEKPSGSTKFRIGDRANPIKEWAEKNDFYYKPK